MFCLSSHCQRSACSLALSRPHTTVRCHDAQAFSATSTSQSGFRHAPSSWQMTRSVTVASSRKSLSAVPAPWPDLVSRTLVRRTRLDRLHSSARLSKLAGSAIPTPYSSVRLFSSRAACGAMKAEDPNGSAAGIMGAEDASVLDNGQNEVPPGMPVQDGSLDPESEEDVPLEPEELQDALTRPPPVNSNYLPLPWNGRLGYACLNTYLRYSNPPVFCSRTCRIASILENRHPLQDPSQPPHPTKNRPDREQPADVARGQAYVESLGLANARDLIKILKWNDKYGIKFMRMSSEMFPFASHKEYGYKLEPFAAGVMAEIGQVAADLGHRVTVHPGQFTQLGSPRKEVTENSFRDLEYHSEMLRLLKLPPQQDRDAVMILHMGGVFGDKQATLDRFRESYANLSQDIKNRLVLENDDVSWSVHDLLPICEELNIPLVLDYHHHNIIFDSDQLREGTLDIMGLYDRIKATWMRKNITQKMHYSEPTAGAITGRQRRKHSPRVATLPPCDPTMDLMIEAKDKEQAVFELMRTFKLPGYELVNDIIPYIRTDENKQYKPPRRSPKKNGFVDLEALVPPEPNFPEEEVGMGGPERRVYWPPGMEEWLRPKRVIRTKAVQTGPKKRNNKKAAETTTNEDGEAENGAAETATPDTGAPETPARKTTARVKRTASVKKTTTTRKRKASETPVSTPPDSNDEATEPSDPPAPTASRRGRRSGRAKKVNYAEESESAG